jgi:hypothetical protein
VQVLFRNNHFSTVLKYNSELYALVTDQGFQSTSVMWEALGNIDGDTTYVNSGFAPINGGGGGGGNGGGFGSGDGGSDVSGVAQEDRDMALARTLSREETLPNAGGANHRSGGSGSSFGGNTTSAATTAPSIARNGGSGRPRSDSDVARALQAEENRAAGQRHQPPTVVAQQRPPATKSKDCIIC